MAIFLPIGRRVRQVLTVTFVFGALLCMFPQESYTQRVWSSHAQQLVLIYLALALFFLIVKQERLMFVCFGCCAAMAYFLNEKTNSRLYSPLPADTPRLKIAHFNVGSSGENYADMVKTIASREADLISCQEVSPDWASVLASGLAEKYPFAVVLPDIHSTGLAVFSKTKLLLLDTFYMDETPNLVGGLHFDGMMPDSTVFFIASITRPALNGRDFKKLSQHFQRISFEANRRKAPVFAFGEYNVVPWAAEILDFKNATRLLDSRQPMQPTVPNGYFQLLEVPVDHIFYSAQFDCLDFQELSADGARHVGIEGLFQLKPAFFHVEKTPQ